MDLVILVTILMCVIMFFRKFSNFVYAVAIIDIFLRIMEFIKYNLGNKEVMLFISKYFPNNVLTIINKYSSGMFNEILAWVYVGVMGIFLFYTIRTFFNKRK